MCGIAGIVALEGPADLDTARSQVQAMLDRLSHRGPDALGQVAAPGAVLGATRLAIRGLEDGRQPLVDPESGVVAVCNGEIDNHQELRDWLGQRGRQVRSKADVAVIPGLYLELGDAFAARLAGAFAVAIWDPRCRRLTLARDRCGERPLFFLATGGRVVFATEIAALLSSAPFVPELDRAALGQYLQLGVFPSPSTPFAGIAKVAPGECTQIDPAGVRRKRYWRWPIAQRTKQTPSLEAFDRVFRAAVRRQSEADVEFGVFLSGGIDSSLVAAVARSLGPAGPLKAYTLRFEEQSYDEGRFAETVASLASLDLVTVWVRPEDLRAELKSLIRTVGEPLADPAWLPTGLLARRAAQDVRLALVGEGADELFGGYPAYVGASLAEGFCRLPAWIRSPICRAVEAWPPTDKKVAISFLLKRFVQGAHLQGLARHRLWVSNISPGLLGRLGCAQSNCDEGIGGGGELLDEVQRWDLETSLAEGLLTKADRASMSSALELRAPFLDEAVMEFAAALPVDERVRGFDTKVFLKSYASRYLPEEIVHRRKRGLSVPITPWLRGPLHDWALAALGSPRLEAAGVRPTAALELLAEHTRGEADHARALWALLVLSEWLDWLAEWEQRG